MSSREEPGYSGSVYTVQGCSWFWPRSAFRGDTLSCGHVVVLSAATRHGRGCHQPPPRIRPWVYQSPSAAVFAVQKNERTVSTVALKTNAQHERDGSQDVFGAERGCSPEDSTSESSERLLQRGQGEGPCIRDLVKGKFTQSGNSLTKGFLLVTSS